MVTHNKILHTLPEHGWCFICGSENPNSLGVRWRLMDDHSITAEVNLSLAQQGPPGFAHGGASAGLIDEAMGSAVWAAGHQVVAVELKINYHKPLPLKKTITVRGWISSREGRAIHTAGEILLEDGTLAVSGNGVYVEAPQFFIDLWKHIKTS